MLLQEDTDLLKWKQRFGKYLVIKVYHLYDRHTKDNKEFGERLQFAEHIIGFADELQPATVPS
jgi:hypothetical protein